MIVYKRTNQKNGMVYIGQTIREGEDPRWPECVMAAKAGKGGRLGAGIREFGPEVFKKEDIYKAKNQHELDMMEIFFIIMYQSRNPKYGYNLAPGGDGGGVFKTGKSLMKGLTHTQFYGEEKAKEISKKLSDLNLGTKKGVWITNGIKNRVTEDPIPEGWWQGRTQKKYKPRGHDPVETVAKRVASTMATWERKREKSERDNTPLCSPETSARLSGMARKAAMIRWSKKPRNINLLHSCHEEQEQPALTNLPCTGD